MWVFVPWQQCKVGHLPEPLPYHHCRTVVCKLFTRVEACAPDLWHCPCLTVRPLAGLEGLHLISLSKITNEGILPLKRLSKLKHIMLARCPNVCEAGLPVSMPICKFLPVLNLINCKCVDLAYAACRQFSRVAGATIPDGDGPFAGGISRSPSAGVYVRDTSAP